MNNYRELLIGCGYRRVKDERLPTATELREPVNHYIDERRDVDFRNLVTLDINPFCNPDIIYDLTNIGSLGDPGIPYYDDQVKYRSDRIHMGCDDNTYDEIHAYEVLEHIGEQGNHRLFFAQFAEFHRILKPNGFLFALVPHWASLWAWGDPSHARVINEGTLAFLSQEEYARQLGKTPMSDYRDIYQADFKTVFTANYGDTFAFVLQAIK